MEAFDSETIPTPSTLSFRRLPERPDHEPEAVIKTLPLAAFLSQRRGARRRGIAFDSPEKGIRGPRLPWWTGFSGKRRDLLKTAPAAAWRAPFTETEFERERNAPLRWLLRGLGESKGV